ncbi:MAG: YlxR family protein [Clostridia bacterium]|nr:YlxR family protein [Clostridia bacterium]
MRKLKRIPERRCVVCNTVRSKNELLRIVKNKENEILVDLTGKKSGRGAYICRSIECLEKLEKTGRLNKTFEMKIDEEIYKDLRDVIVNNSN